MTTATTQIPLVSYLRLDADGPTLVGHRCQACGANFFDRRVSCAACPGRSFESLPLARTGTVGTFTIVHRAARGVVTPFVSAVVDLDDGYHVRSNIVGVEPVPGPVRVGLPVRLTTFSAGRDREGTEAIGFAFEPIGVGS